MNPSQPVSEEPRVADPKPPQALPLPPELAEALVELLAQALVAELMEAKASETLSEQNAMDVSPSGHARKEKDAVEPAA